MAITNQERVGKAMELLRSGLAPFVEREMKNLHQAQADNEARRYFGDDRTVGKKPVIEWDVAALLKLMWEAWNAMFARTLGRAERSLVQELRDCRNKWAHQEPFSSDDADRALDSMARLLTAVSATQAEEVTKMKLELRRTVFDEQVRAEKQESAGIAMESRAPSDPKPWREVVTPHKGGASGKYDPLYQHLVNLTAQSVVMTFAQVEAALGFKLPPSAQQHQAWWSNEDPETTRHRHSRAWTLAGRIATPNLKTETVRFKKTSN